MKKFTNAITAAFLMLALIPFADYCAVSSTSPIYTHFIYMFAHANVFHWLLNAAALVILHKILSLPRVATAYITAVAISFLNCQLSIINYQLSIRPQAVLGFSVILYFLVGTIIRNAWKHDKTIFWQTILFLTIGFFLPNIAATYHLLPFLAGFIYHPIEQNIRSFLQFYTQHPTPNTHD
ncbi:MAG: hypothetical protein IKX17_05190 [Prevotella sp.]|nr:hypothetical protein [Prevotella sp.]